MESFQALRASPRTLVSWVSFLKKKRKTKNLHPTETLSTSSSIFVFYPRGVVGHLCLTLSASHCFLDFGEAVGFHPFFANYFALHNSYIRILAIHRYKGSLDTLLYYYREYTRVSVRMSTIQQCLHVVAIGNMCDAREIILCTQ